MKKTPETDGQSEIRSFAFEKISGSHQSRNQKRNIYDHEEYDDQSDQIWNNRFGNPLDRKSRDTRSNKQVDGNRRCDHTDRDADNEQDTEVNGADPHCLYER